ncbi:zinc finger BED domain-containing protein RICESLEEPER 2-like [Elaeis guineensis]|uniref:zinc finger BED domain-containing protein RICESLEEPER 2-like n=1 Tax=Elaeis guineensis var. tenera TaxID=51953 RepID=UPI003C6D93FF
MTSNMFIGELALLHVELQTMIADDDSNSIVKNMILRMKEKYNKYWGWPESMNILLFIACILDPRYKMVYLSFNFSNVYDSEYAENLCKQVRKSPEKLCEQYKGSCLGPQDMGVESSLSSMQDKRKDKSETRNLRKEMFKKHIQDSDGVEGKSEIDVYLVESVVSDDNNFDVLSGWKLNAFRFKVLSQIA